MSTMQFSLDAKSMPRCESNNSSVQSPHKVLRRPTSHHSPSMKMNILSSNSLEPICISDPAFLRAPILPDDSMSSYTSSNASSCSGSDCTELPPDFQPSYYDIMCGRGKGCSNWVGNRRFLVTVTMNKQRYLDASTKAAKSKVVDEIVRTIESNSPNAGFIKQEPSSGRWYKISHQQARNKVAHAMRDAIGAKDKKTKRRNRRRSAQKKAKAATAATALPLDVKSNAEVVEQVSRVNSFRRKSLCRASLRNSLRCSLRGSLKDPGFAAFILEALGESDEHDISLVSEAALFHILQDIEC